MILNNTEKAQIFAVASKKIAGLSDRGDLLPHNNDSENFMTVSVWSLSAALEAVYLLGRDCDKPDVQKLAVLNVVRNSNRPLAFEEIMRKFDNEVKHSSLYEVLAELVARKQLVSWVDDDGCIVYE